ncbi:NACHT domain-containing protein [Streptomyces sp. NPDC054933]
MLTDADSPWRLVVLGELGAGKSALVLRLTLRLLGTRSDHAPVPVPLAAGSWDPEVPLEDWVVGRLIEQYPELGVLVPTIGGAPRTLASLMMGRQRVLPILDGLDEMEPDNLPSALGQLSAVARRGQPLVVTCKSQQYRELMAEPDCEPLEDTPVVELAPVTLADLRSYLPKATAPPADRWERLFEHVQSEPAGVLAEVLSTPLMVWLARTVYRRGSTDPGVLVAMSADREQVTLHLLDGLIPAAYAERSRLSAHPGRSGAALEPTRRALTGLARYLEAHSGPGFAWWRLYEQVPAVRIRMSAALATGCVLGPAVGIAVDAKYGPRAGFVVGLADAVVAGVLCAVTVMIPKAVPRRLNFRFSLSRLRFKLLGGLAAGLAVGLAFGYACARGGGVWAGVVVFLAVTPVGALAVGGVFGPLAGATGGTSAGLAFGLAAALVSHRSSGVLAGLATGGVFTVMGWLWTGLYEPSGTPRAISPDVLYRADRTSSLVVGSTSGVAYGLAYAVALGPWIGALATLVLAYAVTMTVSSWGQFVIAVLWRPLGRPTPLDVMGLLREAHERGVVRQQGMYYAFRHDLLGKHLATAPDPNSPRGQGSSGQSTG